MSDYDITAAFRRIENELIASMIRNMDRHRAEENREGIQWTQWQAEQLKALERYKIENRKKYQKEFRLLNDRIGGLIRAARDTGNMEQELEILYAIKKGFIGYREPSSAMQGQFFRLNERKLEALIKATTDDIKKAETAILRMSNDKYRKTIFNAQVYANSGAGTYEKAVDMATKDMLRAGLNYVEYSNGARHTLSDYADMAIRTASKRAYLQGEGEKRQEWGISTVIINKRGNPCPKCLPWVGKVLVDDVWSGGSKEDGRYPLMSHAIAAGLYHPRCKDSHTTYFPGISTANDVWTRKELEAVGLANKEEAYQQYAQRQADTYARMAMYSLDEGNRKRYQQKAAEWKKEVDNTAIGDILVSANTKEVRDVAEINQLGSMDTSVLNKEFGKIQTDEIIITGERLNHIKSRHPADYDLFLKHGVESIQDPDIILKDNKNKGTVFIVKKLPDTNLNVVVRVVLETDDSKLKNSVMTFYRVRDKNLKKMIEKNPVIYKKE